MDLWARWTKGLAHPKILAWRPRCFDTVAGVDEALSDISMNSAAFVILRYKATMFIAGQHDAGRADILPVALQRRGVASDFCSLILGYLILTDDTAWTRTKVVFRQRNKCFPSAQRQFTPGMHNVRTNGSI